MPGSLGLQQVLRMQGMQWGDMGQNDQHIWFDNNGKLQWDSVVAPVYNVQPGAATSQDVNVWTVQMPQLTAQFGSANPETFRAFAFNLESDTTSQGYGGIMNALIARVDMMTVGATWSKVEAIAGVINTKSSMTSGTVTDGYGTSGEILHAGGSTITQIRGLSGNVQITAAGNIGTAYGTDSVVGTTLGQTGTVTVKAVGAKSVVQVNNVNAMQFVIGAENYIDLVAATTITSDMYGAFNYFQNTGAATISGNAYGAYNKAGPTGAMVFSGVVYAEFNQAIFGGTTVGGTTNVASNSEIQWNSTVAPTNAVLAGQFRARVSQNVIVTTLEALRVMAPVFANSGTATSYRGQHFLNQGSASIGTSTAILIDAQSGSTNNFSINALGGTFSIINTGAAGQIDSQSQNFTLKTSTSGTLSLTSAGLMHFGAVAGPAYDHTPQAINSTATATAAQAASGYITSTSAAPTTITLPTGTNLGAALGATQGTIHYLTIDNTAGASTVTIAVAVNGILSADAVANAASAGLLTIPSGVTGQGTFMLMFSSATAYTFSRIA